jgi:hypothetical protein
MKRGKLLIAFLVLVLGCSDKPQDGEIVEFIIHFSSLDYDATPVIKKLIGKRCEISTIIGKETDRWLVFVRMPEDMDQIEMAKILEYMEKVSKVEIGDF